MQLIALVTADTAVLDTLHLKLPREDLQILVDAVSVDDDDDDDDDGDNGASFCPNSQNDGTTTKSSEGPTILSVSGSTSKATSKGVDDTGDEDDDGDECVCAEVIVAVVEAIG